jgi:hypothetical protein
MGMITWPTAAELATELRRRAGGGLKHCTISGHTVRTKVDHVLVDAADLLEHMEAHLNLIADEHIVSFGGLQELKACRALHRNQHEEWKRIKPLADVVAAVYEERSMLRVHNEMLKQQLKDAELVPVVYELF